MQQPAEQQLDEPIAQQGMPGDATRDGGVAGDQPHQASPGATGARTITDPDEQARALTRLAETLARAGDLAQARALAGSAEQVAHTITDPYRQAQALISLAKAAELPEAGRLLGAALSIAPWELSLMALATSYPNAVWACPVSTDIQDQGTWGLREDVHHHGERGKEAVAASAVVHA
jgi:hypothetical protein